MLLLVRILVASSSLIVLMVFATSCTCGSDLLELTQQSLNRISVIRV